MTVVSQGAMSLAARRLSFQVSVGMITVLSGTNGGAAELPGHGGRGPDFHRGLRTGNNRPGNSSRWFDGANPRTRTGSRGDRLRDLTTDRCARPVSRDGPRKQPGRAARLRSVHWYGD